MKKILKITVLLMVTVAVMIGVPYFRTPGSCNLELPIAFSGALLGCGGEKIPGPTGAANDSLLKINTADASVIENKTGIKVTFVELGSENCMPCRMMKPVLEKLKNQYSSQVKVLYHDVMTEAGRGEAAKFGIRVIPTQVFIDNIGKEYFRHEGFFPFEEVDKILKQKGVN